MVLNVTDEVINGSPKYNITPNGDGTSSIVLSNEVIQNGTALNKALFDKIENVLSYNNLQEQINEIIVSGNALTDTSNFTQLQNYQTLTEGIKINYKVGNENDSIILNVKNDNRSSLYIDGISPVYWNNGNSSWKEILNKPTSSTNNEYISIKVFYDSGIDFVFDLKGQATFTLGMYIFFNSYTSLKIQTSNNGIDWTDEDYLYYGGSTKSVTDEWTINNKRYLKLHCAYSQSSGSNTMRFYFIHFSNLSIASPSINYIANSLTTPINNQRLLMQSSNNNYVDNTLNNLQIDTLLEPSKYYELVYNEIQNKFIAQEVRN